jgi:ElaB/YqjD/DUF883 family membrane-anchored ribosome-binding protein
MKVLEDIVLKTIQAQVSLVIDLQGVVEKINRQPAINKQSLRINQLLESSQQAFEREERILDSSYYDWKNGDISKEQYQRVREEAEKKLEQIRETLRTLSAEQKRASRGIQANNNYFERFLKYQNVEKLDRLMLIELIDKIYVNEDKSLKIQFNFNNQYLLIMDFIEQNNPTLAKTLQKIK